ncbi:MAG: hypothetical protein GY820_40090, partial [Gammaproteobacteria bacterium]|nr:hypothetical protein [Gammaproteobacteria bacterium]
MPSIFPGMAPYYSTARTPTAASRSGNSLCAARSNRQAAAVEEAATEFIRADEVACLADITGKLRDRNNIPSGFTIIHLLPEILITHVVLAGAVPEILTSLTPVIREDMTFSAVVGGKIQPLSSFSHISGKKITTYSQVQNILAHCKFLANTPGEVDWLAICMECFATFLEVS